ncbi:MAG TPA: YbjN domain-containing protein, partial [Stellaceae bacterium]|nr:YbjN domain-containing protein [Stellaceae bacterium]
RGPVYELLSLANEKLWLGHFDLSAGDNLPAFRHAVLLRGVAAPTPEQIEDLVEIAVAECERFYPAFQLVIWGGKPAEEAMATAMIDPIGEA